MRRTYLTNGFYRGQPVILNSDTEGRLAGEIGIIEGDSWDDWMLVKFTGGEYYIKSHCLDPKYPDPVKTEDGKRVCAHCGAIVEDDIEMKYVEDLGWVEIECLERDFAKCPICKQWHLKAEMEKLTIWSRPSLKEAYVCEDCLENNTNFYRCEDCGKWYDCNVTNAYNAEGKTVCRNCICNYEVCDECDNYFERGSLIVPNGDERRLCSACCERFKRNPIHRYGYKPTPKYKVCGKHDQRETDTSITDLLFGVELEVDKGDDTAICSSEIVENCGENVYCKHDGSLTNGIEIVSHPATLEYHIRELGWDKIAEICRKYHFSSHEAKTCGLHVHVGRRQLGDTVEEREQTIAKIVVAVNRHWNSMVTFSRRLSSQLNWAEKNQINYSDCDRMEDLVSAALETEEEGRYQAVNLCNEKTIEFRIFRGTLEVNTIFATLELVSNICKFCKKHSMAEVVNSDWEDLAKWESYLELETYLETRGLNNVPPLAEWTPGSARQPDIICSDCDEDYIVDLGDMAHSDTENTLRSFHPGDYVVVTNHTCFDEEARIGLIGRVEVIDHDVGVQFPEGSGTFHSLNGRLRNNLGYWMRPRHLARYNGPHPDIVLQCT